MFIIASLLALQVFSSCSDNVRREWRELSSSEQKTYLDSLQCLRTSKSKLAPAIGSPHRYGDFAYTHFRVMGDAHATPAFFPWHRAYLNAFERVLQTECGYKGMLPYWDWTLDSQDAFSSSLFSPSSFGGVGKINVTAGASPNYCVVDGPFANMEQSFQSGGCLSRDFNQLSNLKSWYSAEMINANEANSKSFDAFRMAIEFGSHAAVHVGVGGSMYNQLQAANDPLFFMHHLMIDKVWWDWQQEYPDVSMTYWDDTKTPVLGGDVKMYLYGVRSQTDRTYTAQQMLNTSAGYPLCYIYSTGTLSL
jgi:Common central domain of tyrosinase